MRLQEAYRLLGVDESSSNLEIKEKYKSLAKSRHPDKNHSSKASNQDFILIKQAYDTIVREHLKQVSSSKKIRSNPSDKQQHMNAAQPGSLDHNRFPTDLLSWLKLVSPPEMKKSRPRIFPQRSYCSHKFRPDDICLKCH